jgi:hypothetical protein
VIHTPPNHYTLDGWLPMRPGGGGMRDGATLPTCPNCDEPALLLKLLTKRSPREFFRAIRAILVTAFSTSSSNATLPTALRVTQEKLGVPRDIASFVLTLGSSANQNGTALFEGVTILFLAQFYGVELSLGSQALVVLVSDNESWRDTRSGGATETMRQWAQLKARCPQAKLVCIDLQPYTTTQAPDRSDILNVGDFSDAVFSVVASSAMMRDASSN